MINNRESRGPAFDDQATDYPWPGKVPVRVQMIQAVSDAGWHPSIRAGVLLAVQPGQKFEAYTNRYGAVSIWIQDTKPFIKIGVKPGEFRVIEFCEMQSGQET